VNGLKMTTGSDKAHLATWLGWAGLFLTQALDAWQMSVPWIIWLGTLLPLVIFIPGMLRNNLRSYIWLCFVSLLYFIVLVERLFAQPDSVLNAISMLSVVTVFTSGMFYVRWKARELKEPPVPPLHT
jgi:uncharacterized membrane protein